MKEDKKIFARMLRQQSTETEKIVWEALRNRRFLNLKFGRQHVIEGFVIDFYCHKLHLAIEIDGRVHDRHKDYDNERQAVIESEGIQFVRVTNKEITSDVNILLDRIRSFLNNGT